MNTKNENETTTTQDVRNAFINHLAAVWSFNQNRNNITRQDYDTVKRLAEKEFNTWLNSEKTKNTATTKIINFIKENTLGRLQTHNIKNAFVNEVTKIQNESANETDATEQKMKAELAFDNWLNNELKSRPQQHKNKVR